VSTEGTTEGESHWAAHRQRQGRCLVGRCCFGVQSAGVQLQGRGRADQAGWLGIRGIEDCGRQASRREQAAGADSDRCPLLSDVPNTLSEQSRGFGSMQHHDYRRASRLHVRKVPMSALEHSQKGLIGAALLGSTSHQDNRDRPTPAPSKSVQQ
jgi:hypothetical protein